VVDERKNKVGFSEPAEGVSGDFEEEKSYQAQFVYSLDAPNRVRGGQLFPATVHVRNDGNHVTQVKLYRGSELGSWSFELRPGDRSSHTFQAAMSASGNLAIVAGFQMVSKNILVTSMPVDGAHTVPSAQQ
jgi:hypothetical protein